MGVKRIVDTDFWTDIDVIDNFSPEDKYFALYLLTNAHSKQAGIYRLPKRYISFETGYTKEVVEVLLQRFEDKYKKIKYNHETQEVAILKYTSYSIVKGGKPVEDCLRKDLANVRDLELVGAVIDAMQPYWKTSGRPFDQTVKKVFLENYNILNENENENDNDNEESFHESSDESSEVVLTKNIKEQIIKEWNNLGLSQIVGINNNTKRHKALRARVKEYGVEGVIDAINNIKESDFLQGKSDSSWVITFDWFVRPNNFLKVLEGNYANKEVKNGKSSKSDGVDEIFGFGFEI